MPLGVFYRHKNPTGWAAAAVGRQGGGTTVDVVWSADGHGRVDHGIAPQTE
jgi:hypothetical protein